MAATASMSVAADNHEPPLRIQGPTAKRTKKARVDPKISVGDLTPNNIGTLRKLHSVLFPVAYSDRFYKEVLSPELEDFCKLVYYNDIPVGAICCRIERDPVPGGSSTATADSHPAATTGKLYLMTLGILAPYRRQGLASKLVSHVLEKATEASLAASLTPLPKAQPPPATKGISNSTAKPAAKSAKGKGKASTAPVAEAAKPSEKEQPPTPAPLPEIKSIYVHVQISNDEAKAFWLQQGFKDAEVIKNYYKPNVEPRDAWLLEKEILA